MPIERVLGVDGCRAGWFGVVIGTGGAVEFGIFSTISELWRAYSDALVILIDVPIGLASGPEAGRLCDAAARKLLKPFRHSSVFSPPCRPALSARSYAEACALNAGACGRKISRQAWGITGKIKEVDEFLQNRPEARGVLRETHPEIGFWALAGGIPMAHAKRRAEGRVERLALLERVRPEAGDLYAAALNRYARKDLAGDDVLDALVNAESAAGLASGAATLPENPPQDDRGLSMEMVYAPAAARLTMMAARGNGCSPPGPRR